MRRLDSAPHDEASPQLGPHAPRQRSPPEAAAAAARFSALQADEQRHARKALGSAPLLTLEAQPQQHVLGQAGPATGSLALSSPLTGLVPAQPSAAASGHWHAAFAAAFERGSSASGGLAAVGPPLPPVPAQPQGGGWAAVAVRQAMAELEAAALPAVADRGIPAQSARKGGSAEPNLLIPCRDRSAADVDAAILLPHTRARGPSSSSTPVPHAAPPPSPPAGGSPDAASRPPGPPQQARARSRSTSSAAPGGSGGAPPSRSAQGSPALVADATAVVGWSEDCEGAAEADSEAAHGDKQAGVVVGRHHQPPISLDALREVCPPPAPPHHNCVSSQTAATHAPADVQGPRGACQRQCHSRGLGRSTTPSPVPLPPLPPCLSDPPPRSTTTCP